MLGTNLKEVDVTVGVAQAEHVLLLRVLGDGLDDPVLGQQSVTGQSLLLWRTFPIRLVKQERAAWRKEKSSTWDP